MEGNRVRDIVLTREQSEELLDNLCSPKSDIIEKRDEFLSGINQFEWEKETSYSFSVDIPTLDLTFVKTESAFSYNLTQEVILERKIDNEYMNLFENVVVKIKVGKVMNKNNVAEEPYYCDSNIDEEYDLEINNLDKQAA